MLNRMLSYQHGFFQLWEKDLAQSYGIELQDKTIRNVVNVMTNEFPTGSGRKTYSDCVFIEKTGTESMSCQKNLGNVEEPGILQDPEGAG